MRLDISSMDKRSNASKTIRKQHARVQDQNSTSESISSPCPLASEIRPSSLSGPEVKGCPGVAVLKEANTVQGQTNGVDRRTASWIAAAEPRFTMREYVLAVRRKDLKKTWPFSQNHLRLWLDRGKEPLLPPLDPPNPSPLFPYWNHDCHHEREWEAPKEDETVDTEETEPQISSKEGSTLPESEFHMKDIEVRKLSYAHGQLLKPSDEENIFEDDANRKIRSKRIKRHRKLSRKRKHSLKWKAGRKMIETKIRSLQRCLDQKTCLERKIANVQQSCLGHELLKGKCLAKGKNNDRVAVFSKNDALLRADVHSRGDDMTPNGRLKVVQHRVEKHGHGKECSSNCKTKHCNVENQSEGELTSLLLANKRKDPSKHADDALGETTSILGEISEVECGVVNLQDSKLKAQEKFDQLQEEGMGRVGRQTDHKREYVALMSKELQTDKKGHSVDRKEKGHELTEELTNVLEESLTRTDDSDSEKRNVELSSGAMISDSVTSQVCPVCCKFGFTSNTALNAHMDHCLTVGCTLVDDPVRSQKFKPKLKIRSIADICAKTPVSVPYPKTKKHCNSKSSKIFQLKGKHIKAKCQISALKPCETTKKGEGVKKNSKRRRTISDLEDNIKNNLGEGMSRSYLGLKRKQLHVDSDSHSSHDTTKSTTTS